MFANQYVAPVSEFGEDPNGRSTARGLLTEIWTRVQGFRTHPYGPADKDPSITFNGYAIAPQDFRGLGNQLGPGTVPYRNGGYATIASGLVEGPLGDPSRRIFAQRLARRQPSGGA
ncbi:hypothetical protein AB0K51_12395 [Kitasatospora sp. NPDC049285]|uniref:hypothetical protein n=1 Tax=Kitasatospora sp. NPDC049285 TaxID=3157096 RepID=UPI00341498E9